MTPPGRVINKENMEHILNKPIESRRAYKQRRHTIAFGMVIALVIAAALVVLLVA